MGKQSSLRLSLLVEGQVQGVGFRPFVWRIARECGAKGFARNTSHGVHIEIEAAPLMAAQFEFLLFSRLPPLAKITGVSRKSLPACDIETDFQILPSLGHGGQNVLVSPDVGICAECLKDIRDKDNPRFNYAFTNCTNCGPRFSITRAIPYDRPFTSMACFELCPACLAEYQNPADRRFHAQPIACPRCGPRLWYVDNDSLANSAGQAASADPLELAGKLLLENGILALKGLGGFQLACNAMSEAAIAKLRKRKRRPHKPLALMANNLDTVRHFCQLSPAHEKLLESGAKPIVLCPQLARRALPGNIAPDTGQIGFMLANTPLHALLLDWLHTHGLPDPVLVMTSANPPAEPICLGNREAIRRLANVADGWLLHDRDILVRVDDSVTMPAPEITPGRHGSSMQAATVFLRRARGYVPAPLALSENISGVLGVGAELKSTFCLTRGRQGFVSQHIGDLKSPATLEFFREALKHMQNLLETDVRAIVRDRHPDFISSGFARDLARENNLQIYELQHHAAHAASVLAENNCYEPALALCLDGSGLGDDNTIWGGELLWMDLSAPSWKRIGSFTSFPLPGGEQAILEPWRIALALNDGEFLPKNVSAINDQKIVQKILQKNINCPRTSSLGRIFDAIAALLGLCSRITYEGQAAIRLEQAARAWLNAGKKPGDIFSIGQPQDTDLQYLDSFAIFAQAARALKDGVDGGEIAAAFHFAIAKTLAQLAKIQAQKFAVTQIGLSGGVMQNSLFSAILKRELVKNSLEALTHRLLPPGDGGISFGQAAWGQKMASLKKRDLDH